MGRLTSYQKFFFCSKEEANEIKGIVNSLEKCYSRIASFNIHEYDPEHLGIEAGYCQYGRDYKFFTPLENSFQSLTLSWGDGVISWTDDDDHIVFPKYLLEGEWIFSDNELKDALTEYGITYHIEDHNPDKDPNELLDWLEVEDPHLFLEIIYPKPTSPLFHF